MNLLGKVIWFIGMPTSGKTVLAKAVHEKLVEQGQPAMLFDSSTTNVAAVQPHLVSYEDRTVIVAHRTLPQYNVMKELGKRLIVVYVRCSAEECERRDQSGQWKEARLKNRQRWFYFTEPRYRDVILDTEQYTPRQCVERVMEYLGKD